MKRLITIALLACGIAAAQVQTLNTGDIVDYRVLNSNFAALGAKAGAGVCGSGLFAVQTTAGGVLCLAVDWTVVTGKPTTWAWSALTGVPSTFAPSAHAASHKHGGTDEIATATAAANSIPKAGAGGLLGNGWIPAPGAAGVLGGVDSTACSAGHVNGYNTDGSPHCTADALTQAAVGKADGMYCVSVVSGVPTLTQTGCPGSGGGGGGGFSWAALTNSQWTALTNSQWTALSN